ncbi:MAG: glycosyltransferase [Candidatus Moraniibacteriota bacterium]
MPKSQERLKRLNKKVPKVALVHDFLVTSGGAERVLKILAEMYPEAPIYTLLYDRETMGGFLAGRDIRVSFVQKFPKWLRKRYRWLLPFFPAAIEAMDLRDFDIVISSSGAWGKGVVTRLHTKHIAYIHSPMRYVWDYNERYLKEQGIVKWGLPTRLILSWLRVWDAQAADRPDVLIANSEYTRERIEKYYHREAEVAYPPVSLNLEKGMLDEKSEIVRKNLENPGLDMVSSRYFLVVSRLAKSKKVDIAVEAFNKLDLPLIVAGRGRELESLRAIAQPNVRVIGWRSDEELARLYREARALIFPAEEDFGLVMTEALASGTPVIAYAVGGAKEIVTEGVTGELFLDQTPEVLADGVRRFLDREGKYDEQAMRKTVERCTREDFESHIRNAVERVMKE